MKWKDLPQFSWFLCKVLRGYATLSRVFEFELEVETVLKKMTLVPNYSNNKKSAFFALSLGNFVDLTSPWVGNIAKILSYLE